MAISEEHADKLFFLESGGKGDASKEPTAKRQRKRTTVALRRSECNILPNSTWSSRTWRKSKKMATKIDLKSKPRTDSSGTLNSDSPKEAKVSTLLDLHVSSEDEQEYDFDASHASMRRAKEQRLKGRPVKLKPTVTPALKDMWDKDNSEPTRKTSPLH